MNEKDAAQYVGVSPRTLQRYRRSGRLPYREAPGKTRSVIVYEDADLARLKDELDHRRSMEPKPKRRTVTSVRRVTFGLPPEEYDEISKEASRYGLSVADYARRLVREGLESRYRVEAEELRGEVRRVESEVAKVRSDFAAGFEAVLEFIGLSPEESKKWVEDNLR